MKKLIEKTTIMAIGAILVIAASISQSWAAPILSFAPSAATILPGQSVNIDVQISGIDAVDDVAEFDLDVLYDDTVLNFTFYSLTDNLGMLGTVAEDWSQPAVTGIINLSELSYLSDFSFQADSFTLATLKFTGIQLGSSTLQFENIIIGDAWGNSLITPAESGFVSVVPEPTTMLLLGVGLAGIACTRRKKQST